MKMVLIQPHTHAGRRHAAGETIDVPPSLAAWLIEQGIARHPGSKPQKGTAIKAPSSLPSSTPD
jgi:hypothetical protein